MHILESEAIQRWHLFIHPRSFNGLTILSQKYCQSPKIYLLIHLIGSGSVTLQQEVDLDLATEVCRPALEIQKKLAKAALMGDRAALLKQREHPADLESLRVSVKIERLARTILTDLAAQLQAVPHAQSQTTSVSSLLKLIGTGEITVLNQIDPVVRLKYLQNTRIIKEYLALKKSLAGSDFLSARTSAKG